MSMETRSTKQKTKLLIINYPPKSSSLHNKILNPTGKQRFRSTESGFSGLIVPVNVVPDEATRGRPKKSGATDGISDQTSHGGTEDPTSPKISCIGKTKVHKLKNKKNQGVVQIGEHHKKQSSSWILKIFLGFGFGSHTARKSGIHSKLVRGAGNSNDPSNTASILVLQPRREINLWVRRNTASPPPLQV